MQWPDRRPSGVLGAGSRSVAVVRADSRLLQRLCHPALCPTPDAAFNHTAIQSPQFPSYSLQLVLPAAATLLTFTAASETLLDCMSCSRAAIVVNKLATGVGDKVPFVSPTCTDFSWLQTHGNTARDTRHETRGEPGARPKTAQLRWSTVHKSECDERNGCRCSSSDGQPQQTLVQPAAAWLLLLRCFFGQDANLHGRQQFPGIVRVAHVLEVVSRVLTSMFQQHTDAARMLGCVPRHLPQQLTGGSTKQHSRRTPCHG